MWGTYDEGKPRVRILRRGLIENGVTVMECHTNVWGAIEDKSQVRGSGRRLVLLLKWLASYPFLIWRYLRLPKHDAVVVSYLGHLDVLVLWPFARLRGVPIVWDAFLSLYNTVVEDRRMLSPRNPLARLLWLTEWLACRAADRVVLDTRAHADYFVRTFRLPMEKTAAVFVGAEPDVFPPLPAQASGAVPIVVFYGQFIPLHGIETIIKAAQAAQQDDIDWVIIGTGQEADRIRSMLDSNPIPRLTWIHWAEYSELSTWLNRATVCLGIFGDTEKASLVIPNKVFQILMSGKPLITRDSSAMRELIEPGSSGVWLVPPADPAALVNAVREAVRAELVEGMHDQLRGRIVPAALGLRWLELMNMNRSA